MNVDAAVGVAVKRIREILGISQKEFAALAGLHVTAISQLETGRRGPRLSTFCAVAKGLGMKPEKLLELALKEAK